MSVHRSISLWGVWYLPRKSTPKNEVLRLKTLDLWRLSEDFESEEIGVTLKTWYSFEEHEAWRLCFRSFIFSFLSHRKHRTVKGGQGKAKEKFSKWCPSQNPTPTQSFWVKPLEISYQFSQFLQWQRWRSSGLWGICSDWGDRNSPVRNMIALKNLIPQIRPLMCLAPAVPKYPTN